MIPGRVLVTGGAGFVGTHLVRALRETGREVIVADCLPAADECVDLLEPGAVEHVIKKREPGMVMHLAAQVGRIFGERDLQYTIDSNALMTAYVARICAQEDIGVLYASSSEVYGDQGKDNCWEEGPMVLPHNLYGLSKRWGEEALRLYTVPHVVRLSMPYGVGAPPGAGRRAMDTFLWQAHHRMSISVHRGAVRSWCHISDTVRGIIMAAEGPPDTYNVGRSDRPVAMLELAERCCELTGASKDLIRVVDPPAAQTVVKNLSMAKLRALGWKPRVELDDGLRELLPWVRRFDRNGREWA